MLALSPAYSPKFREFLAAVSTGLPGVRCFEIIYGRNLEQVQNELIAYLNGSSLLPPMSFAVDLGKPARPPVVSPLPPFERDLALFSLRAASPRTAAEARSSFILLATAQPGNAEVEASLGCLAWRQGSTEEATLHFRRAFESGSTDATVLYQYASLVEASAQGEQREGTSTRAALLKALELRPDYSDARLQLALIEFRARHFREAFAELCRITAVKPEQAFCYYSALAYSAYAVHRLDEAHAALLSANRYANSPEQQQRCLKLLARLNDAHADTMNEK